MFSAKLSLQTTRKTMTTEKIKDAVQAHLDWVETLRQALLGRARQDFDIAKVGDDLACPMGQWLYTEEAIELMGPDFHGRLIAIHATFHEIAAEVVASMQQGDAPEVTTALLAGLEDISKGIVSFFEFVNRQLTDGPSDFRTIGHFPTEG